MFLSDGCFFLFFHHHLQLFKRNPLRLKERLGQLIHREEAKLLHLALLAEKLAVIFAAEIDDINRAHLIAVGIHMAQQLAR